MMSEWISVKDRLPDEGQHVLFAGATTRQPSVVSFGVFRSDEESVGLFKCGVFVTELRCVTHWQPLPPPPETQLTVKEALREAVCQLELIYRMRRRHDGERLTDRGGYYIESGYMDKPEGLLPRLRAALEAE